MMMKRLHTLLAGIAVLGMAACSKQQPGEYALEGDRLNFTIEADDDYGDQLPSGDITDEDRTYAFSFVYSGMDAVRDTVWFEATTMGELSQEYRPFKLQQIQREGVMNAESGVHYVAFDDPEVQDLYRVAPDSNTVQVPVIVLRDDPMLQDTTVVLEFGIVANEYFQPGYDGFSRRILEITDRLAKPANWDGSGMEYYYFGEYGEVKHQLMIDWTGNPWDEEYIEEFLNGDQAYISYISDYCVKRLEEENAKRVAAGLDVYREKDGTEVVFGPSY